MARYIFVTGGNVSSIGKGIASASIGLMLKAMGYKVTVMKIDPYLNVDAGTMNPLQHGEVFVTRDGAETDLDLGHYERFIDTELTRLSNVTTGQIYTTVLESERKGSEHLGSTIQVIPHVTDEIKRRIRREILQPMRAPYLPPEYERWLGKDASESQFQCSIIHV